MHRYPGCGLDSGALLRERSKFLPSAASWRGTGRAGVRLDYNSREGEYRRDSAVVKDGVFTLTGKVLQPGMAQLMLNPSDKGMTEGILQEPGPAILLPGRCGLCHQK